jgi:hypothetical protein
MDPTATLKLARAALRAGRNREAAEHYANLSAWLARGGFEPDWNYDATR